VVASQAPTLDIALTAPLEIQIGINGSAGQTMILQTSSNLYNWQGLATNLLQTSRWLYTNSLGPGATHQFYRAVLPQ
jgi:hypothetical protein